MLISIHGIMTIAGSPLNPQIKIRLIPFIRDHLMSVSFFTSRKLPAFSS